MESHPTKLMGSKGFSNRYFDFDKLGEVSLFWPFWVGLLTCCFMMIFVLLSF